MSANAEPSLRNVKGMKETFIHMANELQRTGKLINEYDFYNYYCNDHESEDTLDYQILNKFGHYQEISISLKESIYHTYEKTIVALKHIHDKYDWIIRINISTFINIKLLDKFIAIADNDIIYCNAINSIIDDITYLNELYPRGDFMLFSNKILNKIIPYLNKYMFCDRSLEDRINVIHVDDCLIGCALIDAFGRNYYKHLIMLKYNYMPGISVNDNIFNKYAIATRVKTLTPEAKCSGYSWKDNEYRAFDVVKMKQLNTIIINLSYDEIKMSDVVIENDKQRPTTFVKLINLPIPVFNEYLALKNKNKERN